MTDQNIKPVKEKIENDFNFLKKNLSEGSIFYNS